jgi:aldose 1-epimerase
MALSGERFTITGSGYRAEISEVGAALAGLWHDGAAVTVECRPDELPPKSTGCVLAPWPNRIRDGRYHFGGVDYQLPLSEPAARNASHGLVRWARWWRLEHTEDAVTLRHDLVAQTGYPFELRLDLQYRLGEGGLAVTMTAVNLGAAAAPFGAGFHPYLDLGAGSLDDAELLIPAATVLRADERQIPVERLPVAGTAFDLQRLRPIGELRLDHGFADLTGSVARLRTASREVEVYWDDAFHCLQVFTPPYITPGRNAVAIEPMTCPADAFNSGHDLLRLEPGEQWRGSWGIAVSA